MHVRIGLVGGGTGGHFYPLIAITESLSQMSAARGDTLELIYFGPDQYDAAALDAHGIRYAHVTAGKQRRYRSILNVLDIFKVLWGSIEAVVRLFVVYPDVLMSKGGYTSVPVVFAAWLLRIPVVIHESDSKPGRATTFAARFAQYIAISFAEVATYFPKKNVAQTGIPIRQIFLNPPAADPHQALGIDPAYPLILVTGGSLGAETINTLILQSLDELLPNYTIIHQTGRAHLPSVVESAKSLVSDEALLARYHPTDFMDAETFSQAYAASRIVVSRAGSTSIFEIAVAGKPSIIIPIPETVSHDQRTNAYAYARTGAATVMEEGNLRDGLLAGEIMRIMDDQAVYAEMAGAAQAFATRNAGDTIANILMTISESHAT